MTTQKEIDSLKSRDQRYRTKRYDKMYISRRLVESDPFHKLKGTSLRVFMIFLTKRQIKKIEHKPGKSKKDFYIANNGEIQFTYKEAIEKWHILRASFARAIDQLVELGFIDIAKTGSGLHRDVSLYGISDRWENYGTDEFVSVKRKKRRQHYGFQRASKRISQRS